MKPRYLEPESRSRDRWMVSYVDVLTILLIFFISVALKAQKPAAAPVPQVPVAAAARPAAETVSGPPPPAPLPELQKRLVERGLDVTREQRGVVVSLPQSVLFVSGDDRISSEALPIVGTIAGEIRDLPNRVTLVGYTDAIPISNRRFHNNWELAAARSLRLLELLTRDYGIPESRLSVSSEGSNLPRESNHTPGGRASNRRVEIVIAEE